MERLTARSVMTDVIWFEGGTYQHEPCEMSYHENRLVLEKLAQYEDLDGQGLLHIATIPNGTMIYVWQKNDDDEWFVHSESYLYGITEYFYGEVGKDVFVSEDECREHSVN